MTTDYAGKSILVIDNSPVITRLIKNYLIQTGFSGENIILANDGNQASMMLELKNFDLVTTSMHIKFVNGIDLLKIVRGNSDEKIKNTPFLIISAERKEYFVQELEKIGYDGYLQKPFTSEQLKNAVNDVFHPNSPPAVFPATDKPSVSSPPQATPLKIDLKFINPFIESTTEALGQYMAQAVAGEPLDTDQLTGDFSAMIDLTDTQNALMSVIVLSFPKNVACKIYAGIFGEVELEQVCGVVQELGNIIAGIVKPKISDLSQEIFSLVYPGQTMKTMNGGKLNFQLGLPVATMKDNHTITLDNKDAPRFSVPFDIEQEKIGLLVQFQEYKSSRSGIKIS